MGIMVCISCKYSNNEDLHNSLVTSICGKYTLSCSNKTFYGCCKSCSGYLNPGQVPVLVADQPLFAFAKQIQWTWPATYGEDQFVIMFGGLHNEMAILKVSAVLI